MGLNAFSKQIDMNSNPLPKMKKKVHSQYALSVIKNVPKLGASTNFKECKKKKKKSDIEEQEKMWVVSWR